MAVFTVIRAKDTLAYGIPSRWMVIGVFAG